MKRRDNSIYDVYDVSWHQSIFVFIVCLFLKLWFATIRVKLKESHSHLKNISSPKIVVIWHNRIFSTPILMRRFHKKIKMAGLVSPSRDGAILSEIFKNFGVQTIRGSSDRRALASLMESIKALDSSSICITPDGPRGPMYKVKRGALKVAELSEKPMLIIRANYKSFISINAAWDKFMIPFPFSTIEFSCDLLTYQELSEQASSKNLSAEEYLTQLLGR